MGEGTGVGEGMGVLVCGGEDDEGWVVEGGAADEAVGVAIKKPVDNGIGDSLEVTLFCARAESINQVVRSLNL